MPRAKSAPKRIIAPDSKYNSELVAKFVNYTMQKGKKLLSQKIVYGAMDFLKEKKNQEAMILFEQVMNNVRPQVEVRSRRVGGANYQVPMPVSVKRQNALAFRWLIASAKARKGKTMKEKLGAEMMDALENTGGAVKKREEVHRMAEANKAFAHFARFAAKK